MPTLPKAKKDLGLFGVFALATGATLSSGFFLLPSFATQIAGPAVVLAYLIAGLLLIPPMLSKIELGTAMPRSGRGILFSRPKPWSNGWHNWRSWHLVSPIA